MLEDIVSLEKSMGLELDEGDVHIVVEEHEEELSRNFQLLSRK